MRPGGQGSPFREEEAHDGAILGTTLHINLIFFPYFQVLNLIFLVLKFVNDNFCNSGPLKVYREIVYNENLKKPPMTIFEIRSSFH